MYIDFAIALILLICIFRGERRGLVRSFINMFGWVFSLGGAFLLYGKFVELMDSQTTVRSDITTKIVDTVKIRLIKQAADIPDGETLPSTIMSALSKSVEQAYEAKATELAAPYVDALMSILAFILLLIGIKLVLFVVERILMHFVEDGPLSTVDSIGGILLNTLKGMVVCYLLVLLMIFVAVVGDVDVVAEQVSASVVVNFLSAFGLLPFTGDMGTLLTMDNVPLSISDIKNVDISALTSGTSE